MYKAFFHRGFWFILAAPAMALFFIFHGCSKDSPEEPLPELTVQLTGHFLKHDLYYQVPDTARSLTLLFSSAIDPGTVEANLSLSDCQGTCEGNHSLLVSGNRVVVQFNTGFCLHDGWQYWITLKPGLRALNGSSFPKDVAIQLRTIQKHPGTNGLVSGDSVARESIVVISDIHMGDARSSLHQYGWFGENGPALVSLLDGVLRGNEVRQVVILGDLLDEWIVPFSMPPFDSAAGITDNTRYFLSVAANPVNLPVIEKLRAIAASGETELVYVPGNHDMLLTSEILQQIIPGISWESDAEGLGRHVPVPEIVMEHGHRYDFFNCPQPLVNSGHILPPGFFVSRLYAQGNMEHPGALKSTNKTTESLLFCTAWDVAIAYTIFHFKMTLPDFWANNILMSGINNYALPFSYHGAKMMYDSLIEGNWSMTQSANHVRVPIDNILTAITNGYSNLFQAAQTEYMKPPAPVIYRIVAFGHTHQPMIDVFPAGSHYTSIYANSGSWVDEKQSSHDVRTYLLITPGAWSGSALDVVSLYQYNPATAGGFEPTLIKEESIESL